MSGINFYRDAAEGLLSDLGFESENHETLLADLQQAMGEAALEAGHRVLREHGLGWALDGRQRPSSGLSQQDVDNRMRLISRTLDPAERDRMYAALEREMSAPAAADKQGPPSAGEFCDRHFSWLCQAGQGACQPATGRAWGVTAPYPTDGAQ